MIAINTRTKAESIAVLGIFQIQRKVFNCGLEYIDGIDIFDVYKEETCITFEDNFKYNSINYGSIDFFKKEGYKIISFEEFLKIKDGKRCPHCGKILESEE
jgi:hypothetical protein